MAEEIKSGSIQLRRDTLANWEGSTVILRPGEIGIAIDQDPLIIKVGVTCLVHTLVASRVQE